MLKKVILIVALAASGAINAQKAYKGLEFGMTKAEATKEFKSNKAAYTTATIGSFNYRLYVQNNQFDSSGELISIVFVAKGGGMTGVLESEAKDRLRDLIRFMNANKYTSEGISLGSSEYEYDKDGVYNWVSPDKKKIIQLTLMPNPSSTKFVYFSLWIRKYDQNLIQEEVYVSDDI